MRTVETMMGMYSRKNTPYMTTDALAIIASLLTYVVDVVPEKKRVAQHHEKVVEAMNQRDAPDVTRFQEQGGQKRAQDAGLQGFERRLGHVQTGDHLAVHDGRRHMDEAEEQR